MSTKFRASHMRCAPGYHHYDITVLIIGKPNSHEFIETLLAVRLSDGRLCVGGSPLNEGNKCILVPNAADGATLFTSYTNDVPSQWLGRPCMGVRSLISGRRAVPNFSHTA